MQLEFESSSKTSIEYHFSNVTECCFVYSAAVRATVL